MSDLDLVGTTEIAEMAGVRKNVIVNWIARYSSFPDPIVTLACGRIWHRSDVAAWLEAHTQPIVTRTPMPGA